MARRPPVDARSLSPLWKRRSPAAQELAERLDQLGLFDYLDAGGATRAKEAVARKGIEAVWATDLRRDVFAGDAEDLAEGGVGEFLEALRPYLVERGVTLGEVEDRFGEDEDRYDVDVGDTTHSIYDLAGADVEARESMARIWGLAWTRAFEIVNGLLAGAGSQERAYTVPEWSVWFLTAAQFHAIRAATPEPRNRPYEPVDEPPWYGEDH